MKELPLDFAVFIEYLVPGFVLLAGLAPSYSAVTRLFERVGSEHAGAGVVVLLVFSLAAGLALNPLRTAVCDRLLDKRDLSFIANEELLRPVMKQYVSYETLLDENHREVFLLAERTEGAQLQFYGNAFVAIVLSALVRIVRALRRWSQEDFHNLKREAPLWLVALLFGFFFLYMEHRGHLVHYSAMIKSIGADSTYNASKP